MVEPATLVDLPIYDDEAGLSRWHKGRVRAGLTALEPTTTLSQRIRQLQPFVDQSSVVPNLEPFVAAYTGTSRLSGSFGP